MCVMCEAMADGRPVYTGANGCTRGALDDSGLWRPSRPPVVACGEEGERRLPVHESALLGRPSQLAVGHLRQAVGLPLSMYGPSAHVS